MLRECGKVFQEIQLAVTGIGMKQFRAVHAGVKQRQRKGSYQARALNVNKEVLQIQSLGRAELV